MIKHLMAAMVVGGITVLASLAAQAKQPAQVMAGDPAGRNVVFSFDQGGVRIETHLAGNPGAKLSIWTDHSSSRLFSRILTTDDCKYGGDGARCRFMFDGTSSAYRRFVIAFKRGKTAHIEVKNAAVMQMSDDISLIGFARKLGLRS